MSDPTTPRLEIWEITVTHPKGFGGHEFEYQQTQDLFKCALCGQYEVVVRDDDGEISPCPGATEPDPDQH